MRLPLTEAVRAGLVLAPPRPWQPFVIAALAFTLTLGALTGAIDLWHLRVSMEAVPVDHHRAHGFAQLFGFLGLFTMGMSLHLAPRFFGAAPASKRRQALMTWAGIGGVVLLVLGRFGALLPGAPVFSLAGAVSVTVAMSAWALLLIRFFRDLPQASAMHRFLVAGSCWWWLASVATLGWALGQSAGGPMARVPLEAAYAAALFGGTGSWLWGIFMRAGVCTLKVKAPSEAAHQRLFVAWQVASAFAFVAPFVDHLAMAVLQPLAMALAVGLLWFTVRPFSGHGLNAEGSLVPRAIQAGLVFVALFGVLSAWSAASQLGLWAPPLLRDASRHAFTLGGATLLVLGFAGRMVPGFGGSRLRWVGAYDAGVIAVALGALLRMAELLPPSRAGLSLAGASGGLAFLGLSLCAASLLGSLKTPARE